jgi:CDP-glucose 4,6-dehydratase
MSGFWAGKKVLLTGHTGFKGAWMVMLLKAWGADIYGYALPAEKPSLFDMLALSGDLAGEEYADICDHTALSTFCARASPDIVIHMAAQALVLPSYGDPVETFRTNVLGTATLLDVVRKAGAPLSFVNVTSDKVYENLETGNDYAESDRLGGSDPYSASKACAELVTASFRRSFFHGPAAARIKSARAGNVIGGGDWAAHRLIPDAVRAAQSGQTLILRNAQSVRPWQHVLEPLSGYLLLAAKTASAPQSVTEDSFNFGPARDSCQPTRKIIETVAGLWGDEFIWRLQDYNASQRHEAGLLHLDSRRAQTILGWQPRWTLDQALAATVEGYKTLPLSSRQARAVLDRQIADYFQNS